MLEDVVGHVERVREVPPGVDVDEFAPEPRAEALAALVAESRKDPQDGDVRHPDPGNAERFAEFFARRRADRPLLREADREQGRAGAASRRCAALDARAVIVGFGDYRGELEAQAPPGTLFTGALEHRHLVHLLPLATSSVVPSIFPEAFGMVAAEAASAGVPPVVADHSGLAEVGAGIAAEYPPELAHLVTFPNGDAAALRERLRELLALPAGERRALGLAARRRGRAPLELDARRRAAARPLTRLSAVGDEQKIGYEELLAASKAAFEAVPDFTVAVEEEFALLDPATLELVNRFEERAGRRRAAPSSSRTSSAS